jgi:diguanylate cyclase (GGDEF)-like protein/PAS domain S-box-containing protein
VNISDSSQGLRPALGLFFAVDIPSGAILDVDVGVTELSGWIPEEVVGSPWSDWLHPDDLDLVLRTTHQLLETSYTRSTTRIRHADGEFEMYECDARLGSDRTTAYIWARNAADMVREVGDLWQYKRLGELTDDVYVVCDLNGTVITVNAAAERAHGVAREDMVGRNLSEYVAPGGSDILEQITTNLEAGETTTHFSIPAIGADGSVMVFDGHTTFDEYTQRFFTVVRDVTDRVARERELEITHNFFDLSSSQLVLLDRTGEILRSNPSFRRFVGIDEADLVGRDLATLLLTSEERNLREALDRAMSGEETVEIDIEAWVGGTPRTLTATLLCSGDGREVFFSSRDVTEETRLAKELLDRATHDQLTRLANREVFNQTLDSILVGGFTTAVIMLDLDDFKRVNDSLGHDAGDELLSLVGSRLVHTLRPDDLVARFGGDEFVVLLRGPRAEQDAMTVAEKIRGALAEPYVVAGRPLHVTTSLGVAIGSSATHTSSQLFAEADAAAYKAKRSGRNQAQLFDENLERVIRRQQRVEGELRRALDGDGIDIDVQGIFSVDGPLVGLEALVRVVTVDGRRLMPDQFLDVARRLGLLARLGEAVFNRSLEALGPWLRAHPDRMLNLNADPSEIAAPSFLSMFMRCLEVHEVDPRQLVLEVTESGFLAPDGRASLALDELRKMGMRIAIDDFGTGASSLGYLRDLRIDQVKIDRTFVDGMTTNAVARTITSSVVRLAGELGIDVVAEGVEFGENLEILRDLGCPYVQGYLLHRPQSVAAFLAAEDADAAA